MKSHNFENLDVWKRGCRLAVDVCVATHGSKEFELIEETREISKMLRSLIDKLTTT